MHVVKMWRYERFTGTFTSPDGTVMYEDKMPTRSNVPNRVRERERQEEQRRERKQERIRRMSAGSISNLEN